MKILFEDDHIIVAVKPAGIASQKNGNGHNMVDMLAEFTNGEIYPVHRLDTVTSGVMVYAKNAVAAAFLSREIAEGRFTKKYEALVHGCPEETCGVMEDLLFRDSHKNKSYAVKRKRAGVKAASLEYRAIGTAVLNGAALTHVEIKLHTGRTHQIRVQFASRKMPVYGDGKYGASDNVPFIALASTFISFKHPVSGEQMEFSANPDFV